MLTNMLIMMLIMSDMYSLSVDNFRHFLMFSTTILTCCTFKATLIDIFILQNRKIIQLDVFHCLLDHCFHFGFHDFILLVHSCRSYRAHFLKQAVVFCKKQTTNKQKALKAHATCTGSESWPATSWGI